MATIDELEHRMRFVESEIQSEKQVSHAVLQQAVRNAGVLNTLRSEVGTAVLRLDQLTADVAIANAALHSLTLLQQDVTTLRNDATALRRGQEELHVRFDRMQEETNVRFDRMQEETNARFDRMQEEAVARHAELLAAIRAGGSPPA